MSDSMSRPADSFGAAEGFPHSSAASQEPTQSVAAGMDTRAPEQGSFPRQGGPAGPHPGGGHRRRRRRGGRGRGRGGRNRNQHSDFAHGGMGQTTSLGGSSALPLPSETDFIEPMPREDSDPTASVGEEFENIAPGSEAEDLDDEGEEPKPLGQRRILVNAMDSEESRVAVVNRNILEELYVNIASQTSYLGNIYKGRVINIEPSIDAAFVDFGAARNGFLHASDVMPIYGKEGFQLSELGSAKAAEGEGPESLRSAVDDDEDETGSKNEAALKERPRAKERLPIQKLLRKGQEVVVQITKDGIGGKGPSLTTFISIPGRYLVMMPSLSRCGVSRKINDEKERRRLKKLLEELNPPPGMGFIVRTAGVDRSKKDLQKDLDYLMRLWKVFERRLSSGRAPQVMYEESDLAIKTMRDVFSSEIAEVLVDSEPVYRRIQDFVTRIMPRYRNRVKLYNLTVPVFHNFGIEVELEKLFQRKLPLPSGGSIVIDQAEALVAIDVNSGKYRREADLEETAYRTNLDAIPEIVRQIRLRDLGGVIVIDFIDMIESKHRRDVERSFRDHIRNDRARIKLARISPFGILEMTRQRMGPGLKKALFSPCSHCGGGGMVKTPEAMSLSVLRDVQASLGKSGFSTIEISVHPDVEHYLSNVKRRTLLNLEDRFQKNVILIGDAKVKEGEMRLRFLASDGHEVRVS